jgi:membrane protein
MRRAKVPQRRPSPSLRLGNLWTGRAAAAGWLALAATILAWPRREPLSHRFWRAFGNAMRRLRGVPLEGPEGTTRGRGFGAESPADIPLLGWKDIALRTWSEFNNDRITQVAGGVAFFALLAVFPALAAFVSLYGLFGDVGAAEKQLSLFAGVLPHDTIKFAAHQMARFAARGSGQLSLAFFISLLVSVWSANGAVKALFEGLNVAYEQHEKRGFLVLNLISLVFTVGGLVFVIVALSVVVLTPIALTFFGYRYGLGWLAILRWPAMLAAAVVALSVLYRYGPSRQRTRWRWITWGGAVAALLWLLASMGFSWYVGAFAHYGRTYGSLGAGVVFMTWIWFSSIIVLAGAELNSEIEAQSSVDTSVEGRPAD